MPKRKSPQKYARLGEKDCWHSYSLQMLTPAKFNSVVGKILRGNYSLITARLEGRPQEGFSSQA